MVTDSFLKMKTERVKARSRVELRLKRKQGVIYSIRVPSFFNMILYQTDAELSDLIGVDSPVDLTVVLTTQVHITNIC